MSRTKLVALLLTACLLLAALAACSSPAPAPSATSASAESASQASSAPEGGAIEVTDMMGHTISLEEPATRIVAITPSTVEILFALGAGDTVVGRGTYCDYPAETEDIPVLESGQGMNVEQVMALEPQLVLMTSMDQTEEQVKALEAAGAQVMVTDAQDIAGVYESIQMIGAVVGKTTQAEDLTKEMQESFAEIESQSSKSGKTVYFEVSPLEYGLWTAGGGTFMDEIATMLGLENLFADVDGWGEVSQEQVIERNPDYIVTITMYFGEGEKPVDEVMGRDGWDKITAIQNGAVFNADNNEVSRPGPRLVNAAQSLQDFVTEQESASQKAAA